MANFSDLENYFKSKGYKMIIAADAEPRISKVIDGKVVTENPAGGVAVALDSIAQATHALYIGRAKNFEEKNALDKNNTMKISGTNGDYTLKRLFFSEEDVENYYAGFSNQALWPLCHIVYEEPKWRDEWYQSYVKINEAYAAAIKKAIPRGQKTFIWINDYQLALVPKLLGKQKNVTVGMFWHIPWPTWEIFRILPYKREILRSLLFCDFLGFHRGYQARNFTQTVERELQSRFDYETQTVFYHKNKTHVKNLPMGIDTDVVKSLIKDETKKSGLRDAVKRTLNIDETDGSIESYFARYKILFGVDRLDYTKGLRHRLASLDRFYEKNPGHRGKTMYLGIIAPSRENIPSYQRLHVEVEEMADRINEKYARRDWKPIHLIYKTFQREEIVNFYSRADVCVVTPLDDGMNLVSKEFIVASSKSNDPGMLVLSQFTGSAIDLSRALIVNPYDTDKVADAIKLAIEMPKREKVERIKEMASLLDDNNVYEWGMEFIRQALLTR
jgi:trehalose-6-phosphate synthase